MSYQAEAQLENDLISQLKSQGYQLAVIKNEDDLLLNLKDQLEAFNNIQFSDKEYTTVLNHLEKGNIFAKAKTLRDRFCLVRENGENVYVRFLDTENPANNLFQCTHQVTIEGMYKNRYMSPFW